ncbi:MAG TPA: recombination protein RecR, partial [Anaerolineales bacterium]|nr:recombination protein RecR [Anaerolineales bacterium]
MLLPEPIQRLMDAFARLPGIGPKTASRLTFFLLRESSAEVRQALLEALEGLQQGVAYCQECFNITEPGETRCPICRDESRDAGLICVVEEPLDVLAIERAGVYQGRYHVLHGVLSPIEGVGPEELRIAELVERVARGGVQEVILATNPSLEGDATALYIRDRLKPYGVRVTRLARGLPSGGDVEYADQNTLRGALAG